jgi:hypothetical protein
VRSRGGIAGIRPLARRFSPDIRRKPFAGAPAPRRGAFSSRRRLIESIAWVVDSGSSAAKWSGVLRLHLPCAANTLDARALGWSNSWRIQVANA